MDTAKHDEGMITAYIVTNVLTQGIRARQGFLLDDGKRFRAMDNANHMDQSSEYFYGNQFYLTMEDAVEYAKKKIEKRKAIITEELRRLESMTFEE